MLLLTMPVHCRLDLQVIADKYLDVVAFVHVDQRAGLLAVDQVYLALEAICREGERLEGGSSACKTVAEVAGA